jgi:hypothetical protein
MLKVKEARQLLSHSYVACKWLMQVNDCIRVRLAGRATYLVSEATYPGKFRLRQRELAGSLVHCSLFAQEVTQMSPPIRDPWTGEGS